MSREAREQLPDGDQLPGSLTSGPRGAATPGGAAQLDLDQAARLVHDLSLSMAFNRWSDPHSPVVRTTQPQHALPSQASIGASAPTVGDMPFRLDEPLPGEPGYQAPSDKHPSQPEGAAEMDEYMDVDAFCDLPMPYNSQCTTTEDLTADWVSYNQAWESLKCESFLREVLFSARVIIFAVAPLLVLTRHEKTASFFVAGQLMPMLTALLAQMTLGEQCMSAVVSFQTCIAFMVWGTIMNAVGAKNSTSGFWCSIFFASFFCSMLGDFPATRVMLVHIIIVMQMANTPGGERVIFLSLFVRDYLIIIGFSLFSCVVPFPMLATKQLGDAMHGVHRLYGAGIGNAMKAYWAPVIIDKKMALGQVPFPKIRDVSTGISMLMHAASYEPSEFNLNNTLRGECLTVLMRVRMYLYQLAAAAAQRMDDVFLRPSHMTPELREFEKRVKGPCLELAGEVIAVLSELGKYVSPKDVAEKINYDQLYNRSVMLSDIIERERGQTFFLRRSNPDDTNSYLRTFAFMTSLVDIAAEIEQLEQRMKSFDASKYPNFWERSFNFLFYDNWLAFWDQLPKRLTLATPRDVRLLKDSIKYACGFTVAAAFTSNFEKDTSYAFGFAILMRLAQQTASETLTIGIYRMCGLCVGSAFAYLTVDRTHNLAQMTLMCLTFAFVALTFSHHPIYGQAALYAVVLSISGLQLAELPQRLLVRIADNVFAFITFFLICAFIFPMDPIRVLWNTRTKLYMNMNSLVQTFVTLGCAPVTKNGEEAAMFLQQAKAVSMEQVGLLRKYELVAHICQQEPTVRGGPYPHYVVARLLMYLSEITSLQEAILDAMARLHRKRAVPPTALLHDIMELTRPFLLDAGKIVYRFLQTIINSTEAPMTWSMEESLNLLWKGQIACKSLQAVTGHIQRNFYAAVSQVSTGEKQSMHEYLSSSFVVDALAREVDSRLRTEENEELIQRLFAMSFHMDQDIVFQRDDMHAFNAIVIAFELLLKVLSQMMPPIIEIHEWEKSRHRR